VATASSRTTRIGPIGDGETMSVGRALGRKKMTLRINTTKLRSTAFIAVPEILCATERLRPQPIGA